MLLINITVIILGLLLTALFTTFEAALVSSDPLKVYSQVKDKNKLKKMMSFFQNPGQVINSLIVAINFVDITVAIFVLKSFQLYFPILEAGLYATTFTILVTLVVGEIIPKAIAITFPRFIIVHFFNIIQFFILLIKPFVAVLNAVTKLVYPKLWKNTKDVPIVRSEVELLFHQNRSFQSQQQLVEMVYRVLSIDNIRIKEAKIPISEVVGMSQSSTVKEFKEKIAEEYFSRVPIYNEDIFDIVGYVVSKEIFFSEQEDLILSEFQHKAIFFPENKAVDDVMEKMELEHSPIAFVIDEFGAVAGMVTKKDLTELIVGGAAEHAQHKAGEMLKNQDKWLLSGRQDIDDLNDRLELNIKKDGFETLSGFMMWGLKDIPQVGDSFIHNSFNYHVKEMQGFFVSKVEIDKPLAEVDIKDTFTI